MILMKKYFNCKNFFSLLYIYMYDTCIRTSKLLTYYVL